MADFTLPHDLPAETCVQTIYCFATEYSAFFSLPLPPPPPFLYRVSNPYYQLAERALPRHADSLHFQAAKLPSPERHDGERLSTQGGPGVHNSKSRKLEIRANTSTEVNLACLADS